MTALDTLKNLAGRFFGDVKTTPAAAPPSPVPSEAPAAASPAETVAPTPEPPPAPAAPGPPAEDFLVHHARERDEDEPLSERDQLVDTIVKEIRQVFDPEIPVNVYDIGLIYDIVIDDENGVDVAMTLTSPMCPVAGTLPPEVEQKVAGVEGVERAKVEITWDPPWTPDMMSEGAKLELGML